MKNTSEPAVKIGKESVDETINTLFNLLQKSINNLQLEQNKTQIKGLLVKKLETADPSTLNHWKTILTALAPQISEANSHHLLDVHAGLELNKIYLSQLSELFASPPYPELDDFLKALNGHAKDLTSYIHTFDKDPKSARSPQKNKFGIIQKTTEQILDEQFDTSEVAAIIANIKHSVEGTPLNSQEQYDLAQQITYINAVGREKPLTLVVNDELKTFKDVTQVSRKELRELSNNLITQMKQLNLDESQKLKNKLRLLAILREQYFRTTGIFLNPKQLIAILISYYFKNKSLEMDVDTDTDTILSDILEKVEDDGGIVGYRILEYPLNSIPIVDDNKKATMDAFYAESSSQIQRVVLHQFEEWKEFLHLVYPKNAWKELDAELVIRRKELVIDLEKQWAECLELSDPQKENPNTRSSSSFILTFSDVDFPRLDRGIQRTCKIGGYCGQAEESRHFNLSNRKTRTSSNIYYKLNTYETSLTEVWQKHRAFLKEKAEAVIAEDPVNALRCHYLEGVSLEEQFKLNKLAVGETKKSILTERKKAHRYVSFGLDVNGAMLQYDEGKKKGYRDAFLNKQLKLLASDVRDIIKKNSTLSNTVRVTLMEQVTHVKNLNSLIYFLVDYASTHLPKDHYTEKHSLQPIILELSWLHQQAGVEPISEMKELQDLYLNNVAEEIVMDLEDALSWAALGNRGFGYWLERSAVTTAANALLVSIQQVKAAKDLSSRQIAIRNLYKTLVFHEAQLEGLWIFSFGHKNTRTLIKQTLATLNHLTVIGIGKNELSADFIHDCKEEAFYHIMNEQLNAVRQLIESDKTIELQGDSDWQAVVEGLAVIQRENRSIYAFNEMYYFLMNKVEELAKKQSKLLYPVNKLRGEIRALFEKSNQEHKDLFSTTPYLTHKAEQLKTKLQQLEGFKVGHVELKERHHGVSDFLDLIIEGSGAHALLSELTHYKSRSSELITERQILELKLVQAKEQSILIDRVVKEQLPLLQLNLKNEVEKSNYCNEAFIRLKETAQVSIEQFPQQFQDQVREINTFKEWLNGQMPSDLSAFPPVVSDSFLDRELIKIIQFPNLQSEEIAKIKDVTLKSELLALQEKMNEAAQPKPWLVRFASYAKSYISTSEGMEDWHLEFKKMLERPERNLRKYIHQEIDKKQGELAHQLGLVHQQALDKVMSLQQQVTFLNEKISEEEKKSGVYVKRITDFSQLFQFEEQLTAHKLNQKIEVPVDPKTSIPDDLPKHSVDKEEEMVMPFLFQ